MIVLGVDVGLTGAVAAVHNGHQPRVVDIPTVECGKTRRIDGRALILLLRELVPADGAAMAFIEDIHAGMGPGSVARSSIARSRGAVESVLDVARIGCTPVHTATWKRWLGLLKAEKAASRQKALALYPCLAHDLRLAKHHNRAEAVLIAHYGARVEAGEF